MAVGVALDAAVEPAPQPLARRRLAGRERLGGLRRGPVRDRAGASRRRARAARAARRGRRAAAACSHARQNGLKTVNGRPSFVRGAPTSATKLPGCRRAATSPSAAPTRRSRAIANGETSEAKCTASRAGLARERAAARPPACPRARELAAALAQRRAQLAQRGRAGTTRGSRTGSGRRRAGAGRARRRARPGRPRGARRSARDGRARAGRAGTRRSRSRIAAGTARAALGAQPGRR